MNNVKLYKNAEGSYSLSKAGEVVLEVGMSDARTRNIVLRCLSALGEKRDEFNDIEAAAAVRILKEFGATDLYMEQYPDSGYTVRRGDRGMLLVTCPMHGDFEISETNFLYLRGCSMCRGVHHRAYPIRSHRKWEGNPVFIKGHAFGVGYSDQRVARMVETLIDAVLTHKHEEIAIECMKAAHSFKIKAEHLKRVTNVAKNAVFLEKGPGDKWIIKGPDEVYTGAQFIAFYSNRPYAELIYHILKTLETKLSDYGFKVVSQTILNISGNKL